MVVMKFGGTSVANAEAIRRMIAIVRGRLAKTPVVVVSALSKVTDLLYDIADSASASDLAAAQKQVEVLRTRHRSMARELAADECIAEIDDTCDKLLSFVDAVCSLGELTDRSKARIVSCGEWLSSTIICHALNAEGIPARLADARKMIVTKGNCLKGEPVADEICKRVPPVIAEAAEGGCVAVTQGFIACDIGGKPAILGRGGSDYSASLIGMALDAERIEIWTDVDGLRTADPRVVPDTRSISRISFEEAAEMAHFGAKVLHPMTIEPAVRKNIPVCVLNSMNPEHEGTVILPASQIEDGVKSVSFRENIILINLFSAKMINVSGFLQRVFEVFSDHNVSVDLISTSEASVSLTMDGSQDVSGVVADLSSFAEATVDYDKAQVSIIGKKVANLKDLLRHAEASARNIYMISQGASFVNLSIVVDRSCMEDVVREIHKHIFVNDHESCN